MTSRIVNAMLAALAALILCAAGYGLVQFAQPVQAASDAKYQPPGCYPFGTVGTIIIVRCIDDDYNVFFANSAGYMMPVGN